MDSTRQKITTLIFVEKYYKYGGSEDVLDRGLTISSYKLAWLAKLVVTYILDNAKSFFTAKTTHAYGIYRDDGIVFLKGKQKKEAISRWIKTFQLKANDLTNSKNLQFTAEI